MDGSVAPTNQLPLGPQTLQRLFLHFFHLQIYKYKTYKKELYLRQSVVHVTLDTDMNLMFALYLASRFICQNKMLTTGLKTLPESNTFSGEHFKIL